MERLPFKLSCIPLLFISGAWKFSILNCRFLRRGHVLSSIWLLATPRTVARQAPLFMGFSGQELWSGVPCPPPDMWRRGVLKGACFGCISHNHRIELFSTRARVRLRQARKLQSMPDCLLISLGKEGGESRGFPSDFSRIWKLRIPGHLNCLLRGWPWGIFVGFFFFFWLVCLFWFFFIA